MVKETSNPAYQRQKEDVIRRQPRKDDRAREPRKNHRIRVPQVRVVDHDGTQLGIIPTKVAIQRAIDAGMDLIEVQPRERPPVCRIMDYGKHKYEQKKKASEQKKKQKRVEVKEVKFRPKTDTHDFEVKLRKIEAFLAEGNRVKVTVQFRGREMLHKDIGADICAKVRDFFGEMVNANKPGMEGRTMTMLLEPLKNFKSRTPPKEKLQEKEEATASA